MSVKIWIFLLFFLKKNIFHTCDQTAMHVRNNKRKLLTTGNRYTHKTVGNPTQEAAALFKSIWHCKPCPRSSLESEAYIICFQTCFFCWIIKLQYNICNSKFPIKVIDVMNLQSQTLSTERLLILVEYSFSPRSEYFAPH